MSRGLIFCRITTKHQHRPVFQTGHITPPVAAECGGLGIRTITQHAPACPVACTSRPYARATPAATQNGGVGAHMWHRGIRSPNAPPRTALDPVTRSRSSRALPPRARPGQGKDHQTGPRCFDKAALTRDSRPHGLGGGCQGRIRRGGTGLGWDPPPPGVANPKMVRKPFFLFPVVQHCTTPCAAKRVPASVWKQQPFVGLRLPLPMGRVSATKIRDGSSHHLFNTGSFHCLFHRQKRSMNCPATRQTTMPTWHRTPAQKQPALPCSGCTPPPFVYTTAKYQFNTVPTPTVAWTRL